MAEMRALICQLGTGPHSDALRGAWQHLDAALSGTSEGAGCAAPDPGPGNCGTSAGFRFPFFTSLLRNVFTAAGGPAGEGASADNGSREALFHSIIENSCDGTYRRDLKLDRYDYLNGALEQVTGLPAARLSQLRLGELIGMVHPEDRERVSAEYARVAGGEQSAGVLEYRLSQPDGSYRWLSDSYRVIGAAEGDPAYLVGNLRDLSAAKNAELSAQSSEETLKALIELMPVGVCLVDFDGKFQYLNRFFLDTFGYDLSDIPTVQQWFLKAYPDPEYRAKVIAVFSTEPGGTLPDGQPVPLRETEVTCKDGSVRHVVFNRQLAQNYRVIILTDITEREKLHHELLKQQKLESLGVLAGGIAHDFNNILTGIVGNLSLARLLFDAQDWSSELLETAESESQRAVKLAAQLLTFASGGMPVKKLVSARDIVNDAVSFALAGSNVKGVVSVPENLHAIEADAGQLGQACNSIIINALQAMPDGGTLSVSAENLVLGAGDHPALPQGNYLSISFSDQGCGIALEDQEKVFDPYFTTKPGGAGLGLAAAHSILTRHGGNLSVRSEPGQGACFTMLLPSTGVPFPRQLPKRPVSSAAYFAGGSVLLMDDEKVIRNIASKMLECLSYQVTTCRNGDEAIALFRKAREAGTPYRMVVMDLTIAGGMGGKEAARHILDIDPEACLIVSSGYSNDPVLADFKKYGFHAALPKPYKLSDIEEVLGSVP
jgi:two-component system, cell cycle sensor histidine kinase and response regulator CckA